MSRWDTLFYTHWIITAAEFSQRIMPGSCLRAGSRAGNPWSALNEILATTSFSLWLICHKVISTKAYKDLVSTWPSVPGEDLPASWRQTPCLLPCSVITYSFQVPMNPLPPTNLLYLKKCHIFFFTPVYLLEKLYCIWRSLNICKGVSGSNSPRRWCMPGWKTSGESNLLAKRHLVPGMHEEWLLLGVSSRNVCEGCTLCLGWPVLLCLWMSASLSPTTCFSWGQGRLPSQYTFPHGSSITS